jgi:flagellar basal-body rod protein FlgG
MLGAFDIAATGMHTQQTNVDVIANNLANVNTVGFKKSRVDFEDMMYRHAAATAGPLTLPNIDNPVGTGSSISSVSKVFSQGQMLNTQKPYDIAIQGAGFLEVLLPDGSYAYTRTGALDVDADGVLVNGDGFTLSPMIQLPNDTESVVIQQDGRVFAQLKGEKELVEINQIEIARFMNPAGLTPMGDNLYVPSRDSGDALYGEPGKDGYGVVAQGFLETSNVDLVEEMTNLMLAQRGYEMNAKVVQAADEILGIINNLRR